MASGWVVDVPLPIQGSDDLRIREQVESALAELPQPLTGDRATLVLRFELGSDNSAGSRSQFERCLALARFLTQRDVSRLRTVALLRGPVQGHAVLPVLACEDIFTELTATLGPAVSVGDFAEPAVVEAYLDIASRRRNAPAPLARALVDPQQHLLSVETLDKRSVIPQSELAELQRTDTVVSIDTLSLPGSALELTAGQLRELQVATRTIEDSTQLASQLGLSSLERPRGKAATRVIYWQLHGVLRAAELNARRRDLANLASGNDSVQIFIDIDSPGGAPAAATRLSNALSQTPAHIRTLAYVQQARGDAWLLACCCERFVASADAILGGAGASTLSAREATALGAVAAQVAARRGRLASFAAGLVDNSLTIHLYQHSVNGLQQPRSAAEHAQLTNRAQWSKADTLELREGVAAAAAHRWGQVNRLAPSLADVLQPYALTVDSLEQPQPNWITSQVERIGGLPWLPQLLVTIGCFALLAEFSAPGVGVPGFLGAVCFLLFFWIQFLNGTADYLEAAMFVAGLLCLALELLVLPGFGAFGIGGIALLLSSLVLASQTFVLPTNSYQWQQAPQGLGSLAAALLGIFGGAFAVSKLLPSTPGLRGLILKPPASNLTTGRWDYLQGKLGVTQTPLRPGGKAAFGDEVVDVLSAGEPIDAGQTVVVHQVRGTRVIVTLHQQSSGNEKRADAAPAEQPELDPLAPEQWGDLFE